MRTATKERSPRLGPPAESWYIRALSRGRPVKESVATNGARITVLMPVKHYHPPYLQQSVASILHQAASGWRLSVIAEQEDHDHFGAVLRWALADSRVRLVANEGRKLAGAINTGMRQARTGF